MQYFCPGEPIRESDLRLLLGADHIGVFSLACTQVADSKKESRCLLWMTLYKGSRYRKPSLRVREWFGSLIPRCQPRANHATSRPFCSWPPQTCYGNPPLHNCWPGGGLSQILTERLSLPWCPLPSLVMQLHYRAHSPVLHSSFFSFSFSFFLPFFMTGKHRPPPTPIAVDFMLTDQCMSLVVCGEEGFYSNLHQPLTDFWPRAQGATPSAPLTALCPHLLFLLQRYGCVF